MQRSIADHHTGDTRPDGRARNLHCRSHGLDRADVGVAVNSAQKCIVQSRVRATGHPKAGEFLCHALRRTSAAQQKRQY